MNTMPGPALPVSVVTSGPVVGGVAIPVFGYSAAPTDGRAVSGGPATRVKVLSASDLVANGGKFYLAGTPLALPVITADANTPVAGGPVIAIYPVNSWP